MGHTGKIGEAALFNQHNASAPESQKAGALEQGQLPAEHLPRAANVFRQILMRSGDFVAPSGAGQQSGGKAWDNTDIAGPWINGMRNALNAQVFSFKHPNFLVVSATHGTAHLALLDQEMWNKYQLAKFAGERFPTSTLIVEQTGASSDAKKFQNPEGVYSGHNLSILALQRRGVVFLGCHNTIWELSEKLIKTGVNPDKLSLEAMAAQLTNHIVPGVVLTPGIVATLSELDLAEVGVVRGRGSIGIYPRALLLKGAN